MKKSWIIIAVIALGLALYFWFKNPTTVVPPEQRDSEQPEIREDPSQPTDPDEKASDQPTNPTDATKIIFYEGNGCSQDIVKSYGKNNIAGKVSPNDEARSVNLIQVPVGTIITVYDSPNAKEDDDFATIVVKKRVFDYCIRTFEASIFTDNIEMTYVKKNGLDGKVSYVKIIYPQ